MIELRALAVSDWTVWRMLRLTALAEAPYAFGVRLADQKRTDTQENWRAVLSRPDSRHVVAMFEDKAVGMIAGRDTTTGVVDLLSMWVAPQARGRGVGDALIQDVERWARARQAHTLRLFVADGNDRAEALYLRNGFCRPLDRYRPLSGHGHEGEYVMVKRLPQ